MLLEEAVFSGLITYTFGTCPVYLSEFIVSEKKMGPVIPVTLQIHHIQILMSCNSTSCVSVVLSAMQYLLF